MLPKTGHIIYNGVRIGERKRLLDSYLLAKPLDKPNQEDGIASAHRYHTTEGQTVNIVGGGNGVTAVIAGRIVGDGGTIRIYEGGKESVDRIQQTLDLNNVADRCELHHTIVGADFDVYGGDTTRAGQINPDQLPERDVLELDCEGAEYQILEDLESFPPVIIVELHPWKSNSDPQQVFELLHERGYTITQRYGHDGVELSEQEFERLFEKSVEYGEKVNSLRHPPKKYRYLESGARWPVVIVATPSKV